MQTLTPRAILILLFVSWLGPQATAQPPASQSRAARGLVDVIASESSELFGSPAFFGGAVINDFGQVTFRVDRPIKPTEIWTTKGGAYQPIAQMFASLPGAPDGSAIDRIDRDFNANPDRSVIVVTFNSRFNGEEAKGIWSHTAIDGLQRIASSGMQAPGLSEGTAFTSFSSPIVVSQEGRVGMLAGLVEVGVPGFELGIFVETTPGGPLRKVIKAGDPAPGIPGATFNSSFSIQFPLSSTGQVAFVGHLRENQNHAGVWTESNNQLRLIADVGDNVPGLPSNVTIGEIESTWIAANDTGATVFLADLTGPGITAASNHAMLIETQETGLSVLAREGDVIPGTNGQWRFGNLSIGDLLNDGSMRFGAQIVSTTAPSTTASGVLSFDQDGLHLIARTGDAAPGTIGGTLKALVPQDANERGEAVVAGRFSIGGGADKNGLWISDSRGHVDAAILEGDVITIAPGVNRTVQSISTSTFGDYFNEAGHLVASLRFIEGDQAVVQIVPEPNASQIQLATIICGAIILAARGHRSVKCLRRPASIAL